MVSYSVLHQAYVKIALHAAKYPHKHVNGVLLGESKGAVVNIVDAIPLLHHWTSLSPCMEIGLDLVCLPYTMNIRGRLIIMIHERRETMQSHFICIW